jgi:poly(A) polymerase
MVEEDATRLAERLRLSNAEATRLMGMAAYRPRLLAGMPDAEARVALYRLGAETFRDRVLIAAAHGESEDILTALALPDHWPRPQFPIKGKDLMACGFQPGPELGATLRRLEERWIASDFTLTYAELLALAKN